jgi:hypothetical protein
VDTSGVAATAGAVIKTPTPSDATSAASPANILRLLRRENARPQTGLTVPVSLRTVEGAQRERICENVYPNSNPIRQRLCLGPS